MKKKMYKFLNLCGLSTESFLAIWPSQYKFFVNEFLIKKSVYMPYAGMLPKTYLSPAKVCVRFVPSVSDHFPPEYPHFMQNYLFYF